MAHCTAEGSQQQTPTTAAAAAYYSIVDQAAACQGDQIQKSLIVILSSS
jgi:hypothetical protein